MTYRDAITHITHRIVTSKVGATETYFWCACNLVWVDNDVNALDLGNRVVTCFKCVARPYVAP